MKHTKMLKWYEQNIAVIALLIFFFPVGLFLMWRYSKWNKAIKWITSGLFALIVVSGAFGSDSPTNKKGAQAPTPTPVTLEQAREDARPTNESQNTPTAEQGTYLVTRVIDGDTIEIEGGQRIRYIGINTPETVDPNRPVQCFGKEASDKNKELVLNRRVKLEKDVSETDKYGRLLRYVWIGDTFVNDYLVRQGFANASSYPPDIKYQSQFTQAQQEAIDGSRGLWSGCSTNNTSTVQPTATSGGQSGSCAIKGNISSQGEKIYHLSGCQSYTKTKIDTSAGERWFCSEQEAINAGWRKAQNCP